MKKRAGFWRRHSAAILLTILAAVAMAGLLFYKLPHLVGGLSRTEFQAASAAVGWHGIFHDPLYLPLKLVRSLVFFISPDHGQSLTRLPNLMFGGMAMLSFGWLIWLWHGARTAVLTTALFATGAWTLHVSRLASFDVLYLWAIPTMLLAQVVLHRWGEKLLVWYSCLLLWGLMLYIPGMVWLVLAQIFSQRVLIAKTWANFKSLKHRVWSAAAVIIWLPLLIVDLLRPGQLALWAGLPHQWPPVLHLAKQFVAVPVHLFFRGPQYPELWLGKAPILDIFTLICAGLGIYFYASHWRASRSMTLGLLFIAGFILVGLGGAFSLGALVALLYVVAAAGLAYILQVWLKVFPLNPLARGLGIGLVSLAVGLGCLYNLRAYFVAWPHNTVTKQTFIYHRK